MNTAETIKKLIEFRNTHQASLDVEMTTHPRDYSFEYVNNLKTRILELSIQINTLEMLQQLTNAAPAKVYANASQRQVGAILLPIIIGRLEDELKTIYRTDTYQGSGDTVFSGLRFAIDMLKEYIITENE